MAIQISGEWQHVVIRPTVKTMVFALPKKHPSSSIQGQPLGQIAVNTGNSGSTASSLRPF